MSHLKERSEKNCLNCNTPIHDRYCHVCGQENLEPEESIWHLVTHVFNDITHFDGKFFSTLKYVIFKPGFLSKEYKAGRRASYLNPVRMYLFTSAIFFLIFYSVTHVGNDFIKRNYGKENKTLDEIAKMDSLQFDRFTRELTNGTALSRSGFELYRDSLDKEHGLHFSTSHYKDKASYDSLLKTGKVNDGWFDRQLEYKEIEMREKYNSNQDLILKGLADNLFHSFPQMLFISLPLFALVLQLLYYRRKDYYYVSHAIFSIHYYVFVFMMMFLVMLLKQINNLLHWKLIVGMQLLTFAVVFFYLYKAMRNFYKQGRGKTILKFSLLNIMMLLVISLLFVVFMLFSMMKI